MTTMMLVMNSNRNTYPGDATIPSLLVSRRRGGLVAASDEKIDYPDETIPTNTKLSIPGKHDVICGRGKQARDHPGNVAFRAIVLERVQEYAKATTKADKSRIVSDISDIIKLKSPRGGFIRKAEDGSGWIVVDEQTAREKIGQSLRDLLSENYASSTGAKRIRRQRANEVLDQDVDALIMTNQKIASAMADLSVATRRQLPENLLQAKFDATNLQVLEEIKKDDRLRIAAETLHARSCDKSPKSSRKRRPRDDAHDDDSNSSPQSQQQDGRRQGHNLKRQRS